VRLLLDFQFSILDLKLKRTSVCYQLSLEIFLNFLGKPTIIEELSGLEYFE